VLVGWLAGQATADTKTGLRTMAEGSRGGVAFTEAGFGDGLFLPGAELAMAYSNLAQLAMLADQPEPTIRWRRKAIALAERLQRPDIVCHALNNVGVARAARDPAGGRVDLHASLAMALAAGQQEHVARNYTNLAWVEMNDYCGAAAREAAEAGIAFCVDHDLDTWRDYMRGGLALTLLHDGQWDQAAEAALQVTQNRRATPLMRNPAVRALASLRMRRGDPDAEHALKELADHMRIGREPPRFAAYAALAAEHAWIADRPPEAELARLRDAAALLADGGSPWQHGELWFWRRKLGEDAPAPAADLVAPPYRRLIADD